MKRQVDKTGGKLWFNENLIDGFQDQLYKALESHYKPYGSCIISGCEVSGSNIAEGIVYLDGKIMPFAGANGVTFPKYLEARMTPVTAAYDDGHSDTTEEIYEAILSSTIPSGEYITISAQGGKTFRQAFQDANNRMVSDAKINEWNASRDNAASDVRGGVSTAQDTLKKFYDWAVNYFSKKNGSYVNFLSKGLIANTIIIPRHDNSNSRRFSCTVIEGHINKGAYGAWDDYINKKLVIIKVDGDVVIRLTAGVANADNIFVPNLNDHIPNGSLVHVFNESECNVISPSYSNIATVSDVDTAITNAANDATLKANTAHSNALIDVRNGVSTELNTLKKLYDWAIALFNTKIDKSALSSNISSISITNAATSKAVNDAKQNAIATAVSDVRGGAATAQNTLKKLYDLFKDYYHSGNANRSDVDWTAKNLIAKGDNASVQISGDGNLFLLQTLNEALGNYFRIRDNDNSEDALRYYPNAQIELFFNGLKKFETTSTGIKTIGDHEVMGNATVNDIIIK